MAVISRDDPIEFVHLSRAYDAYVAVLEAIYHKPSMNPDLLDEPVRITVDPSDNPLYEWRIGIWVHDIRDRIPAPSDGPMYHAHTTDEDD